MRVERCVSEATRSLGWWFQLADSRAKHLPGEVVYSIEVQMAVHAECEASQDYIKLSE